MKKIGVILARLQPIHNGHLALIEKSINENDETYVFIGSANKFNKRNPLPISLRLMLCKEAFKEKFDWDENTNIVKSKEGKNLYIVQLDDLTSESDNSHEWGFYLYSKIVTETQLNQNTFWRIVFGCEFGKTVFLTREEAEQALNGSEFPNSCNDNGNRNL